MAFSNCLAQTVCNSPIVSCKLLLEHFKFAWPAGSIKALKNDYFFHLKMADDVWHLTRMMKQCFWLVRMKVWFISVPLNTVRNTYKRIQPTILQFIIFLGIHMYLPYFWHVPLNGWSKFGIIIQRKWTVVEFRMPTC